MSHDSDVPLGDNCTAEEQGTDMIHGRICGGLYAFLVLISS